jgi:spoIIIJ-associated protein
MNERHRQSVTVSARTVDEAITEAERELGVPRDSLDITVITEGSKGFLGMRAENARILAMVVGDNMVMAPSADTSTAVVAPTSPPADTPAPRGASAAPPVSTTRAEVEDVGKAGATSETEGGAFELGDEYDDETPRDGADEPGRRTQQHQETAALAQDILENLLRHMNIQARVSVRTMSDPIVLDVETDNGGLIIGRRGETLSALQYLVNVLIGKRTRRWTKVVIDVEHWRDRREETLRALALRQADRVRQQHRPVALDPMPAGERRIIHVTLQDQRDIETHSEGEEPNRRLVITPKR